MIGRGSFIESFPLFGYNLNDYEDLFNEKLQMLLKLISMKSSIGKVNYVLALKTQVFILE